MNAKEDRNIRVKKFNGEFQKEGINMKEKNKRFKTPINTRVQINCRSTS